jgi:hypothetical protein
MLRNHAGLIAGLCLALVLSLAFIAPGCTATTASTTNPSRKVDATGLAAEAAQAQADFDGRAAQLKAAEAKFNADVTAENSKLAFAGNDLAHKQEIRSQLVAYVGGLVPNLLSGKALDPTTYTSGVLTLLGIFGGGGALVDSSKKQQVINRMRSPGDPTNTTAGDGQGSTPGLPAGGQAAALAAAASSERVNVLKAA